MKSFVLLFICLVLLTLFNSVFCDLPVHCVGDQIYGEWVFSLGPSGYNSGITCGHSIPDNPKENYATKPHSFKPVRDYKVTIFSNNTVVDEYHNQGFWTMIYDEGFEVRLGHRSFFAFFKYIPRPHFPNLYNPFPSASEKLTAENFVSICSSTVDGWYHFENGTDWGCYYGTKSHSNDKPPQLTAMDILGPQNAFPDFLQMASFTRFSSFLEYSNHFINHVNSDKSKFWNARHYPEYSDMSFIELQSMLGTINKKSFQISAVPDTRADHIKYKDFPEMFDWRNKNGVDYVSHPRKQGSCGSCFAIAATQMVESRIRIMTNNKLKIQLSPQNIISCSFYNQGCDGGFPYLVGKYGQDFGFVEESCLPYQPKKALCSWQCKNPRIWKTTNYHYIGGSYGKCSEVEMMKEIYEKGPIVVGFNAPQDLFWYSEGIYHLDSDISYYKKTENAVETNDTKDNGKNKHAFFEKTNHAVLCVGWGIDKTNNLKYWIVQNTWGDEWGQNGYFYIVRGQDMCSFEAMSVAFDPVLQESYLNETISTQIPVGTKISEPKELMPEPVPLAQRIQVGGHPQVIPGTSAGFQLLLNNDEDSEGDGDGELEETLPPLTPEQMMINSNSSHASLKLSPKLFNPK